MRLLCLFGFDCPLGGHVKADGDRDLRECER